MTLSVNNLQSESDLDNIRNSCDVFNEGNGFCICREASLVLLVFPMLECKGHLFCILKFGKRHPALKIDWTSFHEKPHIEIHRLFIWKMRMNPNLMTVGPLSNMSLIFGQEVKVKNPFKFMNSHFLRWMWQQHWERYLLWWKRSSTDLSGLD